MEVFIEQGHIQQQNIGEHHFYVGESIKKNMR